MQAGQSSQNQSPERLGERSLDDKPAAHAQVAAARPAPVAGHAPADDVDPLELAAQVPKASPFRRVRSPEIDSIFNIVTEFLPDVLAETVAAYEDPVERLLDKAEYLSNHGTDQGKVDAALFCVALRKVQSDPSAKNLGAAVTAAPQLLVEEVHELIARNWDPDWAAHLAVFDLVAICQRMPDLRDEPFLAQMDMVIGLAVGTRNPALFERAFNVAQRNGRGELTLIAMFDKLTEAINERDGYLPSPVLHKLVELTVSIHPLTQNSRGLACLGQACDPFLLR